VGHYEYTNGLSSAAALEKRTDPKAERIRWMLSLPDLSRQDGSPVLHLLQRVLDAPCVAGADRVTFPEIIPVERNFDLLNAPPDHPSRSPSDTYYVDDGHVLRTQTTSMWGWYLSDPAVRARLESDGEVAAVSYGKVYRNDEIDRSHYPVFHQVDAVCIVAREREVFDVARLDEILLEVAHVIYGDGVEARLLDDSFPFTEPSRQLEVRYDGEWFEVVGAGLVHPRVLERLGLDPERVNGWAFGFGLDRLAMARMDIPDIRVLWSTDERVTRQFESIESRYVPVSKYPPTERDISFIVAAECALNDVYEIVRSCADGRGECIVEQVAAIDRYENPEKFGPGRVSHTFRITYRSFLRTLTNEEINDVQAAIRTAVAEELGAELR
jgi:phenylalanyl-tRNA synthetase alpha chain